ncbi:hypothetical protein XELAEV_18006363mg [Xenopus laevis]|uniref:Uncharacterized protein n=1 Tax=Xenopus laevis TaxID=8355 RepID=A0A974DYG4_XENLA|nr:hypothetical protein XELAEV_18006363mg [Xenopus laevis]
MTQRPRAQAQKSQGLREQLCFFSQPRWSAGSADAEGPIAVEIVNAKLERKTGALAKIRYKSVFGFVGAHKDWGPPGFFPVSRWASPTLTEDAKYHMLL